MTQENKELLLKDLCARLPYKIRVSTPDKPICAINSIPNINSTIVIDGSGERVYPIKDIKPYLFPLSSMSEEQKKEYYSLVWFDGLSAGWNRDDAVILNEVEMLIDFYHKNHLDWKGLIEQDLAIDATGLNVY